MDEIKTISLNLNVLLTLAVDVATNKVEVQNCDAKVVKVASDDNNQIQYTEHQINETENRYGILTLGAKSLVGMLMPTATEVTIEIDGVKFISSKSIRSHRSTRGRIDGLTQLFREFPDKLAVGAILSVSYDSQTSILALKSN
ncbi:MULTISPECIES: hypothetical protein [unclassified Sedimentibacter]|uniref:hypothetical protein n=1 Tax=unclassified Sedimentibacter TaxID=2649220 RepID=UPI0027E00C7B|nr:hypothetical protein [Sedimentibacter sp. MB35-C1]WMJ77550.1 hypothetical protein RBQ61_01070 [Sedimentibacter sp. MB35-C1]